MISNTTDYFSAFYRSMCRAKNEKFVKSESKFLFLIRSGFHSHDAGLTVVPTLKANFSTTKQGQWTGQHGKGVSVT